MSGMFKDKNGEPNVGLFFETEYPQSKDDIKAVSGSSDISSVFKDLTGESAVSDFYRQIPQPTTVSQPHSTITTSGSVEPNVGQFAGSEFNSKKYESSWESGKSPADPHKTLPDVDGKGDVSHIYKDISKRADEEINVGLFGPGGEEIGAYQTAWESANIAKEASKLAKEAIDKARNIDSQVSQVSSSRDAVEKINKDLGDGLKDFGTKYTDLKTKVLPEVTRVSNEITSLEASAKTSAQTATSAKDDATKTLGTIKGVETQVKNEKAKIETFVQTVEGLKSTIDKNTQDFINNYLNYRGLWNPASKHYPDPKDGNSVWDVDLADGVSTELFDGKAWSEGDRLFWYKIPVNGSNWVHLKSGSGIVVSTLDLLYQKVDSKNKPDGYAGLGADGKVLPSLMPALSVLDINVDENFYQRDSRTNLQKGDISIIKGAILWRPNQYYKKGDIIYIKDDAAPHELSKNKFHVSDKTFTSGDTFDHSHWLDTTFKTNHIYKVGDEFVYKTKLFIVKSKHTSGATLIDPKTNPSLYEQDDYLDAGMYILQRSPTGPNGTSVAEDWVSFGSDFRVQSFNGRVGTITPESGDYTSEEIVAKTFGSANVTNVQDFLEHLEASKVSRLGGQIVGKISIQNNLEAENIKLTGLGEEGITNAHNKSLLRSGGNGDATIVGNSSENTIIETKDSLLLDINGTNTKVYHEGFRPTPAEINAMPNTWVPAWNDVTAKPETSTRWPLWSEVVNTPQLFGGSYLELKDVPRTFAPSTHSHPWSQIRGIPVEATRWPKWGEISGQPSTATRWPSWNEVTGKPSGILNQGSYDQRYMLKDETAVNALKINNISLNEFFDQDGGSGQTPARIKIKNTDDGKWLHITRRDGQYFSLEQSDSRDGQSSNKTFFTINSSGIYYNPRLGGYGNTGYKVYHEGFKPSASDVKALPENWVPSWSQVTSKPDTATRWPYWREIPDKPTFFSGNYRDLIDKPASFKPSVHRHPWTDIDNIPETATRWGTFNDITNKPATATRWPTWAEIQDKPTDHLTQGRTGSRLQGLVIDSTSDGSKAKYPLTIRRTTSDREKVDIFVSDTNTTFDYTNDETGGSFLFNISNTGLEGNNQAKANKGSVKFEQSQAGTFILVNGKKVYTEDYKPTSADIGAHPNTWVPSWSEVTSKPAQATRWPTWTEVTGKPTNFLIMGADAIMGDKIEGRAGANADATFELNEDRTKHGIRLLYRGSGDNLGVLQGKENHIYKDIAVFPRSGEYFDVKGQLKENGVRVYSPTNKPTSLDVGAYSESESDSLFLGKTEKAADSNLLDGVNSSQFVRGDYLVGRKITDANAGDSTGTVFNYLKGTNGPSGVDHALMSMSFSKDWSVQMAGDWRTNRWYVRNQNQSTWGSWAELYSTMNKPTSADVGSHSKSEADGRYLLKTETAANSSKLENKTVAQIVSQARYGLASATSYYTKGESNSKFYAKKDIIKLAVSASEASKIVAKDDRDVNPSTTGIVTDKAVRPFFVSSSTLPGVPAGGYSDLLVMDTYADATGGGMNALAFRKDANELYHIQGGWNAKTWNTAAKVYTSASKPTPTELGVYTKAESDGKYLGKTEKAASSSTSDRVGNTNLNKTATVYTTVSDLKWWGDSGIGTSQMLKSASKGVPGGNGYAFKVGARDVSKGHAWLYLDNYNGGGNLWYGANQDGGSAPSWSKVFSDRNKPTLTDVGLSNLSVTSNKTVKIQSKYGYVTIGPENSSHMHFGTDRSNFYFSKMLRVNGDVQLYRHADTKMAASNGYIYEKGQRVYSPNNKPVLADVMVPTTASKSLALTANTWTKLLDKTDGLSESGVYQILVSYHSSGNGGVSYSQNYTGQFFWYAGGTNQVDTSEITLHNMGHADNSEFIYLRTLTKMGNKGDQEVQILCNKAITKAVTFTVKLVKLM